MKTLLFGVGIGVALALAGVEYFHEDPEPKVVKEIVTHTIIKPVDKNNIDDLVDRANSPICLDRTFNQKGLYLYYDIYASDTFKATRATGVLKLNDYRNEVSIWLSIVYAGSLKVVPELQYTRSYGWLFAGGKVSAMTGYASVGGGAGIKF